VTVDPDLSWHPEPELIDVRDEAASRPALEALGAGTWSAALDYLYAHAFERALGGPTRTRSGGADDIRGAAGGVP
jgi:hypothetical protein